MGTFFLLAISLTFCYYLMLEKIIWNIMIPWYTPEVIFDTQTAFSTVMALLITTILTCFKDVMSKLRKLVPDE